MIANGETAALVGRKAALGAGAHVVGGDRAARDDKRLGRDDRADELLRSRRAERQLHDRAEAVEALDAAVADGFGAAVDGGVEQREGLCEGGGVEDEDGTGGVGPGGVAHGAEAG